MARLYADAAAALQRWLHSWLGVGAIVTGMAAQGFALEIRQLGDHWRATYYPTGLAHSIVLHLHESTDPHGFVFTQ